MVLRYLNYCNTIFPYFIPELLLQLEVFMESQLRTYLNWACKNSRSMTLFIFNQPHSETSLRNKGVKQGLVRRTILRTTLSNSSSGYDWGYQHGRVWNSIKGLFGTQFIIIMPSPETCFPVSNLLQNLLRYIGSESRSRMEATTLRFQAKKHAEQHPKKTSLLTLMKLLQIDGHVAYVWMPWMKWDCCFVVYMFGYLNTKPTSIYPFRTHQLPGATHSL